MDNVTQFIRQLEDNENFLEDDENFDESDCGFPQSTDYIYVLKGAEKDLVEIGESAVPALIEAIKDENSSRRFIVARVLGRIGDARAVPALVEALKDKDYSVCHSAAEALGLIGDTRAAPALVEALKKGYYVRSSAAIALGRIGDPRTVPALIEALNIPVRDAWEDNRVRDSAAKALGWIGDARAVPALVKALKDKDDEVCTSAARALARIANHAPTPTLRIALPILRRLERDGSYMIGPTPSGRVFPILISKSRIFGQALEKIEKAIASPKIDLPLPSGPPSPAADSLPIPAESTDADTPNLEEKSNTVSLQPPAPGWRQRLRQVLCRER